MADNASMSGMRNPVTLALVAFLVLLIVGFGANFYFANQNAIRQETYIRYANDLKVATQRIAMQSERVSTGRMADFAKLLESKNSFETKE